VGSARIPRELNFLLIYKNGCNFLLIQQNTFIDLLILMVASEWLTLQINPPILKLFYDFHRQQGSHIFVNIVGSFSLVNAYGYLLTV